MTATQPNPGQTGPHATVETVPDLAVEIGVWTNARINQEPVAALAFANRAIATANGRTSLLASAHLVRGRAAFQLDRMPQAFTDAAIAADLSAELGETAVQLKARNLMATSSLMMGDTAKAESILLEGLPAVRAFGDEQIVSLYLGNLAGTVLAEAKVFEAIELLQELHEIAERNGWIDEWLRTANNLATCYLGLRDAESAAHICRQALQRFDDDPNMLNKRAYLLHSLACAMEQMGELAKALSYHEQAVASATEYHDVGVASSALLDAARISRQLGNPARAREHYQHLLSLRDGEEDDQNDSTEYRALAVWGLEAVAGAFTCDTASRLRRLIDRGQPADREQRRTVYDALAESLIGLGDMEAALALLQESMRFRDDLWAETLQLHAYSSAQAIQIQEARRQADEERWRREELTATISQVERLNTENEALVHQLRQQAILLERLSREDSLTGLLNRRAFDERLAFELADTAMHDVAVTTSFVDIDDFKRINDQHSHAVGDQVLQTVARLLVQNVLEGDAVSRYGGEEFVLMLPGVDTAAAYEIGERIRLSVSQYGWDAIAPGLSVTLCIGMWTATGESSPSTMVANADRLLYEAKRGGKNQLRVGAS